MNPTQVNRRNFLKTSMVAASGMAFGASIFNACTPPKMKLDEIGVILYTVANQMKEDYKGTLEKIAEIGYKYIEMGGHYGESLEEFKSFMKRLGLRAIAGGADLTNLQENIQQQIEQALSLNKEYVICYWPWTNYEENQTVDYCMRVAESFNELGLKCKEAGLKFAFHNHDKEFFEVEGKLPYDIFLEFTDPELVTMELDLHWIKKGGADPLKYFKKHPGRFEILHVKDMDNTPEQNFACVGQGVIDFSSIFAQAELAGTKYYIVEHDRPENPIECIQQSFDYLSKLEF